MAIEIPAHVPPELVRDFPLGVRMRTYENPYERLIPEIHDGPEIFYGSTVYLGPSPAWVIRRAEDMRAVYLDVEHYSKRGFTGMAAVIGEDWALIPTELDPPEHTAFRTVLNPLFSPRRMAGLDDRLRRLARELVARFRDKGECDFAAEFAAPYPVSIFLELMGLPHDDMPQFLAWERMLLHDPDLAVMAEAVRAVKQVLLEAIAERRVRPRDDLITNATLIEVEGRPLTDIEVLGHCFNLYLGGLDTVTSTLGLHFHHLAAHPEHQRRLREDPSLIPSAVEELLRAYSAVTTFRICVKQTQIKGVTIMPGDKVAMATPLGNRDPDAFERPNEVLLDRDPTHLTFAFGPHRCIGSHLARRELNIAMEVALDALPEFRIRPGAKIPFYTGGVVHVESLPLVWDVSAQGVDS